MPETPVRGMMVVPMMSAEAEGASETRVPEKVIAGPPGASVWLSMIYSEAPLGVIVLPATVRTGRGSGAAVRGNVVPPIMIFEADGAMLMSVPEIVMAGEPGMRVWPLRSYWDSLLAVIIRSPMVRGGSGPGEGFSNGIVFVPMTTSAVFCFGEFESGSDWLSGSNGGTLGGFKLDLCFN